MITIGEEHEQVELKELRCSEAILKRVINFFVFVDHCRVALRYSVDLNLL